MKLWLVEATSASPSITLLCMSAIPATNTSCHKALYTGSYGRPSSDARGIGSTAKATSKMALVKHNCHFQRHEEHTSESVYSSQNALRLEEERIQLYGQG